MYYVTMTDSYLSGWGYAKGKINKLIFICDTYREAEIVEANARSRSDMKYINITLKKPYYNSTKYLVELKDKIGCPAWYIPGYFSKIV